MRKAHCASATRYINRVSGAIESGDLQSLRQLKQSLVDKLAKLADLDSGILELTEYALEAEVEAAEETRDRINLFILTIDDAL